MPILAGIDGCPVGWFAVTIDTATKAVRSHSPNLSSFLLDDPAPAVAAIDIPIGLTEIGPRQCDLQARRLLGSRASCVFPPPIRAILGIANYHEANAVSRLKQNKGISKQGHALYPRILEVENLLLEHPALQSRVFEVHPELCFFYWNEQRPLDTKHKEPGLAQRIELIDTYFPPETREAIRQLHRRSQVEDHDILDALAALRTAVRIHERQAHSIPDPPERLADGLPMAMWC